MKYELRRLGEAVQYATAIAPYGYFLLKRNFIFSCCSVRSVAKKLLTTKIKGGGDKTQSFLFVTTP
jgi:hypothetical protein